MGRSFGNVVTLTPQIMMFISIDGLYVDGEHQCVLKPGAGIGTFSHTVDRKRERYISSHAECRTEIKHFEVFSLEFGGRGS
jgi:hypothetical protein